MKIHKILEEQVIKTLEKADIWQMVKELDIYSGDINDKLNLENNTKIKLNIVLDSWEDNAFIIVYTIEFDGKIVGVGGRTGDEEHIFNYDTHFIDKQGYKDMVEYIKTLESEDACEAHIVDLDYDFLL